MKKLAFTLITSFTVASMFITSCGNKNDANAETTGADSTKTDSAKVEETPKVDFATACTAGNSLAVTIKGYNYETTDKKDINFEAPAFEVKRSTWKMVTDSTAELSLFNYTEEEYAAKKTKEQVEIRVWFMARNGKKIGPGVYTNSDSSADMATSTKMYTNNGEVFFNWVAGMPESGKVTLNYADDSKICGSFALAAEKPDTKWIGTVKINGSFKVE